MGRASCPRPQGTDAHNTPGSLRRRPPTFGKTEITMAIMTLTVNGSSHTVDVDPTTPLLYVLSDDLNLRGPKFGCGLGQCGACTVLAQGRALRSCVTPVGTMTGVAIT